MAVNKELLERYKAMKAAKLAQAGEIQKPKGFSSMSMNEHIVNYSALQNELSDSYTVSVPASSGPSPEPTNACAYSSHYEPNNEPVHAPASEPVQTQSSWQTTYSQSSHREEFTNNYNSQFNVPQSFMTPAPMMESSDIFAAPSQAEIIRTQELPKCEQGTQIKKFALIGYPLEHSMSEYIHLAGFKSTGINATYEILPTSPEELSDRIKYLRSNNYSGFNVTIPLKLPVTLFLDEIDPSASVVNAINTVTIDPKTNALRGYNTDAKGFISAIPQDFPLYNKTVGILGTGGAARAAINALAQKQVKEMKLYTRNIANCIELIDYLRKTFPNITFNAYQIDQFKDLSCIDLLVNATPIGMSGSAVGYTPVEEDEMRTLPSHALIYDVVYNPKKTNLIRLANKLNYRCLNGVDMLVWQAYEAQKIWTGRSPDFKDMKIALLENL